jgi:hypothetical protein
MITMVRMPLKTFNLVKLVLPILLDSCPLPLIFIALNFLYYAEHSLDKPSSADLIKWILQILLKLLSGVIM